MLLPLVTGLFRVHDDCAVVTSATVYFLNLWLMLAKLLEFVRTTLTMKKMGNARKPNNVKTATTDADHRPV